MDTRKLNKYKLALVKTILAIKKTQINQRYWVHSIWRKKKQEGQYQTLVKALKESDPEMFKKYLRVTPEEFQYLNKITKGELKKFPAGRKALSPGFRLAITLRFLASGDSLSSLSFAFRIGFSTCHYIVKECCDILWKKLQPVYLPEPTEDTWRMISVGFEKKWNFPHCLGAVDGKHVAIKCPPNSGSMFYNYKGYYSTNLMATVDHEYKFISVDIGGYGSQADSGIFKESKFYKKIVSGKTIFPKEAELPHSTEKAPYVLVADEAFQLQDFILRPFPGNQLTKERRIFNYRLSRARRCVENAFGIMSSRFQIFQKPINLKPENCDSVVKAAVVLHNYLRSMSINTMDSYYCPQGFEDTINSQGQIIEGDWRNQNLGNGLLNMETSQARNFKSSANEIRQKFVDYFNSQEGSVAWQYTLPGV